MSRERQVDADVRAEIERLVVVEGHTSGMVIRRELDRQKGQGVIDGQVPHPRTIQRLVREIAPPDPSGEWQADTARPEDAARVLPVLAEVIVMTSGRVLTLTNGQAERIAWLRTVAPDLPVRLAYFLALSYQACRLRQEPTTDLDACLAFAPWRFPPGTEGRPPYWTAVAQGWISLPPLFPLRAVLAKMIPGLDDPESDGELLDVAAQVELGRLLDPGSVHALVAGALDWLKHVADALDGLEREQSMPENAGDERQLRQG